MFQSIPGDDPGENEKVNTRSCCLTIYGVLLAVLAARLFLSRANFMV